MWNTVSLLKPSAGNKNLLLTQKAEFITDEINCLNHIQKSGAELLASVYQDSYRVEP